MSLLDKLNYKIISAILVVALFLAVLGNQYLTNKTEVDLAKLDRALASYYELAEKGDDSTAFSDEMKTDFEALHSSMFSYVSQKSLFTSALIAYGEKNNSKARELYNKLIAKNSSSYLANLACLNLAYLEEDDGNNDKALSLFSKLAKKNSNQIIWSEATFNVARLSEKKSIEESIKLYKELVDKLAEDNVWLKLAQNRLISLAKL